MLLSCSLMVVAFYILAFVLYVVHAIAGGLDSYAFTASHLDFLKHLV